MMRFNKSFNQCKTLLVLSVAAIGMIAAPSSASAFTLVNRNNLTDDQFNALLINRDYTETFVAEGRMGNNGNSGDREFGINNPLLPNGKGGLTDVTTTAEGQRIWTSGELVDFKLEYDGASVKYTVGGQLISSSDNFKGGAATDIFLRTSASKKTGDGVSTLTDLFLNKEAIGKSLMSKATSTEDDADYLQISGITTPFTLTGKSSFTWAGNTATSSRLSYQIKVVNGGTTSVPEPGTVAALIVASGMGLVGAKRKK